MERSDKMVDFFVQRPALVAFGFGAVFLVFGMLDLYLWLADTAHAFSPFAAILFLAASPFFFLMGIEITRLSKRIRGNENTSSSNN